MCSAEEGEREGCCPRGYRCGRESCTAVEEGAQPTGGGIVEKIEPSSSEASIFRVKLSFLGFGGLLGMIGVIMGM